MALLAPKQKNKMVLFGGKGWGIGGCGVWKMAQSGDGAISGRGELDDQRENSKPWTA
jgi:hypothetical protein